MKKKVRLTKAERAIQQDIEQRTKNLAALNAQAQKEAEELSTIQRKRIMEGVTGFTFNTAELDAFVSALDGFPGKADLARALLNAVNDKINVSHFQTKLLRLGIL